MANQLHILNQNRSNNSGCDDSNKKAELNVGLQEYISDLLVEPNKEKGSSLLKTIEKKDVIALAVKNDSVNQSIHNQKKSNQHQVKQIERDTLKTYKVLELEKNSELKENRPQFDEFPDPRLKKVSKLLEKIVTLPLQETAIENKNNAYKKNKRDSKEQKDKQEQIQATNDNSFVQRENKSLRHSLDDTFQTLIFDVNNIPLAVPLIKLGGIVNISKQEITPLVGTPNWFLGLIPNERGNLMVIDTQQFLMPERSIVDDRTYDYLIVLDNSQWALACHNVGDAKNINASDIRWSNQSSKRPWFAGMVVEYMSALIEVDALINLLAEQIVD